MPKGARSERVVGWDKHGWQRLTDEELGKDLPHYSPGEGRAHSSPGAERLEAKHRGGTLLSRKIELAENDDPMELCFERGWTDGLPVTPPTDVRVLQMLSGTTRHPAEIVGEIPPYLAPCTVEKVAINAVLAGCKPEYMPVLLAALEAALEPVFTLHGVLATTYFSSPVIIVNGPVAKKIGMNSGINALGQGNRANATIGRALNLIVRNVGGGRPGEADRATLGARAVPCASPRMSDARGSRFRSLVGFVSVRGSRCFRCTAWKAFSTRKATTEVFRAVRDGPCEVGPPRWCNPRVRSSSVARHYQIYRKRLGPQTDSSRAV